MHLALRLGHCFIAAATFAIFVFGIRQTAPPNAEGVDDKLRFYKNHRRDYDTIIIGSSRIYHGFDPKLFDETMRRSSHPTRTFNFGVDGMHCPEALIVARKILALRPVELKRVLFETSHLRPPPNAANTTARDICWHDLEALKFAVRKFRTASHGKNFKRECSELAAHTRLVALNLFNVGRGGSLIARLDDQKPEERRASPLGPADDGFFPMAKMIPDEDRAKLTAAVGKLRSRSKARRRGDAANRNELTLLHDEFARSGIEMTLVAAPSIREIGTVDDVPEDASLLALDDPFEFENLYLPDRHFDADHLNPRGAAEFTQSLALAFVRQLDAP